MSDLETVFAFHILINTVHMNKGVDSRLSNTVQTLSLVYWFRFRLPFGHKVSHISININSAAPNIRIRNKSKN